MKNFVFIILLLICGGNAIAQNSEVKLPQHIKVKFDDQFVNASAVNWKPLSQSGCYEADFIDEGTRKLIRYSDKGIIIFSETSLFPSQLPAPVHETLERSFHGYDIEQIREVEINKEVKIKIRIGKGRNRFELEVDPFGKIKNKRKIGKVTIPA